jgi:hypothetical protein
MKKRSHSKMQKIDFKDPSKMKLPEDNKDLYEKLLIVSNNKIIVKVPYEKIAKEAYMWYNKEISEEITKVWLDKRKGLKEIKVYSYHTYGGYYGFFRPSLDEIIKIGEEIIRNNKEVFVTTDSCNVDGILTSKCWGCYNIDKDMHMAVSTFWVEKH